MIDFFAEEWGNAPFIDISVTKENCAEYATERVWHGTQEYTYSRRMLKGGRGGGRSRGSSSGSGSASKTQDATPAITSRRFADGTAICVTRSDKPLHNMDESECPAGQVRCLSTKITQCVTAGNEATECPITDVKLVASANYNP